ncbi:MAG: FtsX-like permease family protein [Tissierellia bacterium]|nr:FtsX-like permease family protein [Tissierellia bacterium]
MKKTALRKDIIREFLKSKSRVLSIVAMVALGALAVVGLTVTGPSMRETMNHRLEKYDMPDIIVNSTYGLDYEDRLSIERSKDIRELEYGYQLDVVIDGTDKLFRIESLGKMPKYRIVEGRLPEKSGEVAVDVSSHYKDLKIGDEIHLLRGNTEPLDDELNTEIFKVVGMIQSPEYFNEDQKGRSVYGKGELDGFAVITEDNFNLEVYTIARMMMKGTENLKRYSDEYLDLVSGYKDDITKNIEDRPEKRLAKIKEDANKDIIEAEDKITEAKDKISDGQKELDDAREELDDAIKKYSDGKSEFEEETSKAKRELDDAKRELDDAKLKLDEGKRDYELGLSEFNIEISKGQKKIEDAKAELNKAKKEIDDGKSEYQKASDEFNSEISKAEKELADAKSELDENRTKLESGWSEYEEGLKKYETGIRDAERELIENEKKLSDAKSELESAKTRIPLEEHKLQSGWNDYNQGKSKLDSAKPQIEAGKIQLEQAQQEIDSAYAEINGAYAEISSKESELNGNLNELEKNKASLQSQIQSLEAQMTSIKEDKNLSDEEKASMIGGIEAKIVAINVAIADIDTKIETVKQGLMQLNTKKSQVDEQKKFADESQRVLNSKKADFEEQYNEYMANKEKLDQSRLKLEEGERQLKAAKEKLKTGEIEYQNGINKLSEGKKKLEEEKISKKAELDKAHEELVESQKKFDEGEKKYEDALAEFNKQKADGEKKLKEAKEKLDSGVKEYEDGLKKLSDSEIEFENEKKKGEKKLADAKAELDNGNTEYLNGLAEWKDGKAEYDREVSNGQSELEDAYQKILDGEDEYKEGLKEFEDKTKDADAEISDGEKEIADGKKAISKLKLPKYFVHDIEDNHGIYLYMANSRRMDILSLIFPAFFYAIAMLVTVASMSRMVDENRTQIGTLKSLGYSTTSIANKYFVYGAIPSIVGAILGILLGHTILSELIYDAYSTGFVVGNQMMRPYPQFISFAFFTSIILITGTAVFTTRNTLKHNAATLLRPKAPKVGTRIMLERIKPLWNRLTFLQKVTARNIFRYKVRMLMTIFGVAGCTALLFMGFGLRDSIVQISPIQYGDIIKYDLVCITDEDADKEDLDHYLNTLKTDPDLDEYLKARYDIGLINFSDKPDQEVHIITVFDELKFKDFVSLRDRKKGKPIAVRDDGVVISEKLADVLDLKIGDEFTIEDSDNDLRKMKVNAITENYINHYIYMSDSQYEKVFGEKAIPNSDFVTLNTNDSKSTEHIVSMLMKEKAVMSIIDTTRINYQVGKLLDSLNLIVGVLIVISSILAIVVLYNLTNINVSERIRELSTIKVLGFYSKEVTSYIYRETYLLTIIGILAGYLLGYAIHWFIINVIVPEEVMLARHILLSNYILSAAITLVLSAIVMVVMHIRLKRVDMVEALKAVE